jgi:hypothetical protein
VDVYFLIFLTSALTSGEWLASRPCRFSHGERAPGTHWIGGWVNPRSGLDDVEKRKFLTLLGLELRSLARPARSQSLHRLRYPGSLLKCQVYKYVGPYSSRESGSWTKHKRKIWKTGRTHNQSTDLLNNTPSATFRYSNPMIPVITLSPPLHIPEFQREWKTSCSQYSGKAVEKLTEKEV